MYLSNAATGFDYSEEEYLTAGERIWNITRLFNLREGIARDDDSLPGRMFEPMMGGATDGIKTERGDVQQNARRVL